MQIYEKIFKRLEDLNMSQMELSKKTGIATSTISDWRKKGINPQTDKIERICKALNMSFVELLCNEENKGYYVVLDDTDEDNRLIGQMETMLL